MIQVYLLIAVVTFLILFFRSKEPASSTGPNTDSVTLHRGRGFFHIVGESNYQEALERLSGGKGLYETNRRKAVAELVREPTNSADTNAVKVLIDGHLVGYIPKDKAEKLGRFIEKAGRRVFCEANFIGGWEREGTSGTIGVALSIGSPLRAATKPMTRAEVAAL